MRTLLTLPLVCYVVSLGAWITPPLFAQEPTPDDLFYRKSFMVQFPVAGVQFEDAAMLRFSRHDPVVWSMCFTESHYKLKEIKNCCMYDATGRNLQATASYCDGYYHISVTAPENLYAQGDWVDVQGVAVVESESAPVDENVVFSGAENGALSLKHGSVSWKIYPNDVGEQVIRFFPGAGVSRLVSIGYTDSKGDWVCYEDPTDAEYSWEGGLPSGGEMVVQYLPSGEEKEVPFRYRLTMCGVKLLPYQPEVQTTVAAPIEKAPVRLVRAEHPVTIYPASFYWRDNGTCILQLEAHLFSDTHTIANACLNNLCVKDAKGELLNVASAEVDTDADSVEADITFAVPSTPSVKVSGVLKLESGDTASRLISVLVPCKDGASFSVDGLEGKVVPVSLGDREEIMEHICELSLATGEVQVFQIVFEDVPESLRIDDVVITGDKGESCLAQTVSSDFAYAVTKDDVVPRKSVSYIMAFDSLISQLKVSVDSRKSASPRSFPFSFELKLSGAQ